MKPFTLAFIWFCCAALVGLLLVSYFYSCSPRAELWMPPLPKLRQPMLRLPRPAKAPPPKQSANPPPQSYTYVGSAPPGDTASAEPSLPAAGNPKPGRAADSSLALQRTAFAEPARGAIPDLDLRLQGAGLDAVVRRYGYVPAVKSRSRLLGKIAGEKFLPLAPAELSRYARRGRAGDGHPEAGRWRARVAAELSLSADELQFIFLVPHETEALFVAAERLALERAGKPASQVVLVRAHFDTALAIVVDELITKTGATIVVDSVRVVAKKDLP